jgi:hypothetical protein
MFRTEALETMDHSFYVQPTSSMSDTVFEVNRMNMPELAVFTFPDQSSSVYLYLDFTYDYGVFCMKM